MFECCAMLLRRDVKCVADSNMRHRIAVTTGDEKDQYSRYSIADSQSRDRGSCGQDRSSDSAGDASTRNERNERIGFLRVSQLSVQETPARPRRNILSAYAPRISRHVYLRARVNLTSRKDLPAIRSPRSNAARCTDGTMPWNE
ncbi:hypothetical protein ALC56_14718 [Trachymyrmex septentrionalis]|uniref:Uncharacterized protein n=1 Tax=Trachymyrmex septentrionalis TaxID=34720 RepID=A0A195ERV0_9HYME|nr:hypothetical protein ALC56_14718 [Trachymyrmex septentrionalis]